MRPPEPSDDPSWGHNQDIRECIIHVPTKKVGYLIGKSGRTIFGFERQTGAKIDILSPNSRDPETPVALSGPQRAVAHVIRMIMDLYGCNNFSSQLWKENRRNEKGERPQKVLATERISVFSPVINQLIANEGLAVKIIEQRSGAKIIILPDEDETGKTPIDVTGNSEQNETAVNLLKEKISDLKYCLKEGNHSDQRSATKFQHQQHFERRKFGVPTPEGASMTRKKLWSVDVPKKRPYPVMKRKRWSNSSKLQSIPLHHKAVAGLNSSKLDETQIRFDSENLYVLGSELDNINVESICKENQVDWEIFKVCEMPNSQNYEDKSSLMVYEIIISGIEASVHNAKLDLIHFLDKNDTQRRNNNNNNDLNSSKLTETEAQTTTKI